jgi:hypothetical protein
MPTLAAHREALRRQRSTAQLLRAESVPKPGASASLTISDDRAGVLALRKPWCRAFARLGTVTVSVPPCHLGLLQVFSSALKQQRAFWHNAVRVRRAPCVEGIRMAQNEQHMEKCDVCGQARPYGQHRYELRRNQTYDIMVCNTCHAANWDGWAPHYEDRVTRRLIEKGANIPPRNAKGLLPRE